MSQTSESPTGPRWEPLSAIDRRVAGVLVEKAKTTPEAYPLSLNAVRTAANQKSNRFPAMELALDAVEQSLDRLRKIGAVAIVQGSSRVERFRHYLYEWLGVDKVELAVMAELLLRGAQTEGELRGRAARMEPIADLAALRPVLERLKTKGLIVSLSREGRGHVISHALYLPQELEKLRNQFAAWNPDAGGHVDESSDTGAEQDAEAPLAAASSRSFPASPPRVEVPAAPRQPAAAPTAPNDTLRRELESLRTEVAELRDATEDVKAQLQQTQDELRQLRDSLGA